jgi:hypothetical protein
VACSEATLPSPARLANLERLRFVAILTRPKSRIEAVADFGVGSPQSAKMAFRCGESGFPMRCMGDRAITIKSFPLPGLCLSAPDPARALRKRSAARLRACHCGLWRQSSTPTPYVERA